MMSKKRLGFQTLVETIGRDFFEDHKEDAVFSWGEEEKGLYCFLGIDLDPQKRNITLSCKAEDWDVYASCYVVDEEVILDECRLPEAEK